MPIDHRILNADSVRMADMGGAMERGMRMGEMYKAGQEKRAMKDAYAKANVVSEDGKTTFNRAQYLSDVGKINPERMHQEEERFQQRDTRSLQQKRQQFEMIGGLAGSVNSQETLNMALTRAQEMGLDTTGIPKEYMGNERIFKLLQGAALTGLQQLQLENDRLNRQEARDERRFQHGIKLDEKRQALETPFGLANTPDDAKQLKEGHEAKRNFDNKLDQMIALREKHKGGAVMNREDVARGKQLSKDLLLEYKNMAKLGVLSQADENIINAIIPEDPLQYNSPLAAIQGQDPTLARLKSFKSDSDKDFQTRVETRTRAGVKTAAKPQSSGPSLEALLLEKQRRSQTARK